MRDASQAVSKRIVELRRELRRPSAASRAVLRRCLDAIDGADATGAHAAACELGAGSEVIDRYLAGRALYLLRDYHGALAILDDRRPPLAQLRYSMLKRLRFEQEAHGALAQLVGDAPDDATHRAAVHHFITVARPADALAHARALARDDDGAGLLVERAELAADAGANDDAARTAVLAVEREPPTPAIWDAAITLLLRVGAYDQVRTVATRHAPAGRAALAEVALYGGDHAGALREALAVLDRDDSDGRALEVAIGAAVLGGGHRRAHELLARATPLAPALLVWQGELALSEGDQALAVRALTAARDAVPDYLAAKVLLALASPTREHYAVGTLEGLLEGQLAALGVPPAIVDGSASAAAVRQACERAFARLAGNRTPFPSIVDDGHLRRVWPPDSLRHRVRRLQHSAAHLGIDAAIELVDAAVERTHPIAMCYRAELDLWAGRYELAARTFEEILAMRRRTVWAWIGLGAARTLAGDPKEGLDRSDEGIEVVGWRGATAPIYRAEALLLLGRIGEASIELDAAQRAHPRRLASYVLRVLCKDGDSDAFEDLERRAPALVADAAHSIGVAPWWPGRTPGRTPGPLPGHRDAATRTRIAQAALALMRGNRSSSCAFWFAPGSELVRSFIADRPPTTPEWERDERADLRRLAAH